MNKITKSLMILLHAIVITAVLSNFTAPEQKSGLQFNQDSASFSYPTEALVTTNL